MAEKIATKAVQFRYEAPEAGTVFIAGDFNKWDSHAAELKKDKSGVWKASLKLKPGRYEYKFWVDGEWRNDPSSLHLRWCQHEPGALDIRRARRRQKPRAHHGRSRRSEGLAARRRVRSLGTL